jgi:hypothetical protein
MFLLTETRQEIKSTKGPSTCITSTTSDDGKTLQLTSMEEFDSLEDKLKDNGERQKLVNIYIFIVTK